MVTNILSQNAYWIINKYMAKEIGLEATLLLSDLITKEEYFREKNQLIQEEWFFNTTENIENDTTLSYHRQKIGFKKLEKIGFIEVKVIGIPAKQHFKIFKNKILTFLKQDIKNFKNKYSKNSKTCIEKISKLYNNNKKNNNKENNIKNYNKKNISSSQFNNFWKIYPKKTDKGKTKTKWEQLCNKPKNEKPDWKEIKLAIINQKESDRWQDIKFIPNPTTWLNQSRWLDDPKEMVSYDYEISEPTGNRTGYTGTDFGGPDEVIE